MNLTSIRVRLAVWYLAVLVSALVLLAAGIWMGLRHELYRTLDVSLSAEAAALTQFLERESDSNELTAIVAEAREYTSGLPAGDRLRLLAGDGSPLLSYPATPVSKHLVGKTVAVIVRGHPLRVEISAPDEEIIGTLNTLRNVLFGCIPIVLIVATAGGWWLSRTALQPVDRMTATAESISANDLSSRLPVPSTGDELERFGEAWNRMLDRLSTSVDKMSRFTADAAHELRTPVSIIRSTAELALRRDRDSASYRTALMTVAEESRNLTELVTDLLWLARNDAGSVKYDFEEVVFPEFIRSIEPSIEALAQTKDVLVRTEVDFDTLPLIRADRAALRRVALILADNAIKFTTAGGTVVVRGSIKSETCTFAVQDNGPGISPADLPFIFDRFYSADRSRNSSGFGLGLSIAKTVVDAHGGRIEVDAVPDGGATFRVVLATAGASVRELPVHY